MSRPSGLKYKLHKKNPAWFKKGRIPWNKDLRGVLIPWNKGLTKESDIRVAQCAENLREVNKGKRPQVDYTSAHRKRISDRMKGDKNPAKRLAVREKIRKTLLETRKKHPEILRDRKSSGLNQYSGHFTSIERPIARELSSRSIPYVHNQKVDRYFPDFIISENVIIECDGERWHKNDTKEQKRDARLHALDYFIFHLKGGRIVRDPKECIDMVESVMKGLDWELQVSNVKNFHLAQKGVKSDN